jgi:hypothetical protein
LGGGGLPARSRAPIIALHVLVAFWLSVHAPDLPEHPGAWLRAGVSGRPGCIDETGGLQARAAALLGPAVSPPPTTVEIDVVPAQDDAWTVGVRIDTEGVRAERSLSGRDCATLEEAIALVIAVHVDPLSVATRLSSREEAAALETAPVIVAPPDSSEAPGVAPAGPPREIAKPPRPAAVHERRTRAAAGVNLGAAVTAELGVLPRAAGSVELGVGVRWPHATLEVSGLVSVGPRALPPDTPDVVATFRLYAAAVRGCGVLGRARVQAAMCGGLEAGDLWAKSDGLQFPETVHALWLATTVGVRPRVVLHPRVALGGIVDLLVPLRRHRFLVEQSLEVHRVAPIAARFGLSLQVRLK